MPKDKKVRKNSPDNGIRLDMQRTVNNLYKKILSYQLNFIMKLFKIYRI